MREQKLSSLFSDVKRFTTHHLADKDMLDDVFITLSLHRRALLQPISAHYREFERLFTDTSVSETEFRKFLTEMQAKIDHVQTSSKAEMKQPFANDGKRVTLFIF